MSQRDPAYENQITRLFEMFCAEWEQLSADGIADDDHEGRKLGYYYILLKRKFKFLLHTSPVDREKTINGFSSLLARVRRYSSRTDDQSSITAFDDVLEFPGLHLPAVLPPVADELPPASGRNPDAASTTSPGKTPAPVPVPLTNLAELLPAGDGPTVFFRFKSDRPDRTDASIAILLKKLIDEARPLMGDAGKDFHAEFDLNIDKSHTVIAAEASDGFLAETGLDVALEDGVIVLKGTPGHGYDGKIWFSFAGRYTREGGETHEKSLYIASDPRTLWKNLPVEDYEGYYKPDDEYAARTVPGTEKTAIAASCRGRSHAHIARPRDDHFTMRFDEDSGWNFVAVADGAGSASFSRKGSELACETAVTMLSGMLASPEIAESMSLWEPLLSEWKKTYVENGGAVPPETEERFRAETKFDAILHNAVYSAYMAIHDEAAKRGMKARDYHTTLLVAAFRKFVFGYFFVSYWVGDGAMVLYNLDHQDRVVVLGVPDGGDFAGQTRFLTMREEITEPAIRRRLRYSFAEDFGALILVTDGVTDAFFPSEKEVTSAERWRRFWTDTLPKGDGDNAGCPELFDADAQPEEQAAALRVWLDFWSKGNHDDRTILVVK